MVGLEITTVVGLRGSLHATSHITSQLCAHQFVHPRLYIHSALVGTKSVSAHSSVINRQHKDAAKTPAAASYANVFWKYGMSFVIGSFL